MSNDMGRGRGWGRGGPIKDRTGERYDRLVAVRRAEDRQDGIRRKNGDVRSKVQWLCVCDCGNYRVVSVEYLRKDRRGGSKSCGCAKHDPRSAAYTLKNPLPPGRAGRNIVFAQYRQRARVRGLLWELTGEEFDELTSQDCTYCGCPPGAVKRDHGRNGGEFIYNGIDRKDNTIGYVAGNVLSCCKVCNYAKKDMSYEDFLAWIARLTEYHFFHPDVMPSRMLREAKRAA